MKKTITTISTFAALTASVYAQEAFNDTQGLNMPPPPMAMAVDTSMEESSNADQHFEAEDSEMPVDGYWVKDTPVNEVLQYLARKAHVQYIYNDKIADMKITGHVYDADPINQMKDLTYLHGLTIYQKGNTVYALTEEDLINVPLTQAVYQLRYIRPKDIDAIKQILEPLMTPGRGSVQLEPKTSTLVIRDTQNSINSLKELLRKVDRPKKQVIVETKILRTRNGSKSQTGFDWVSTLGDTGLSLTALADINSIFGLGMKNILFANGDAENTELSDNGNILSPVQANIVLRALENAGVAEQVSNPILITEDNEKGSIRITDRIPIITTTSTQGESTIGQGEEVRYKIDESDSTDPETSREVGISMIVTPTILPDDTIRLKMKPKIASILGFDSGPSGSKYPRVQEGTVELTARIPNGHTLLVGGFYGVNTIEGENKVPVLGDIPGLGFFFKSTTTETEKTSLAFLVKPSTYDPSIKRVTKDVTQQLKTNLDLIKKEEKIQNKHKRKVLNPRTWFKRK